MAVFDSTGSLVSCQVDSFTLFLLSFFLLLMRVGFCPSRQKILICIRLGNVLRSKLANERCLIQFPVALVGLAVRIFSWFSPKLA